jgi:hypothetical protein
VYTLELSGFLNFKRISSLTLDQARAAFKTAKNETYKAYQNGRMIDTKWSSWELYKDGQLINQGEFNA